MKLINNSNFFMLRGLEILTVHKIARPTCDYQDTINIQG